MSSAFSRHHFGRSARVLVAACAALLAQSAAAVEFADGRVQIHGFGEMQVRALDDKFSEELDLAQWYNVLNLELEMDIAPDGFGPFDLISAYVRAEARYDAIYSHGFGMFPSVDSWGNNAKNLPEHLRDAVDLDYAGTIPATDRFGDFAADRIDPGKRDPLGLRPPRERQGFPGFDTFFRQFGPDNVEGTNPAVNRGVIGLTEPDDDPAAYVHRSVLDYQFTFKDVRNPPSTGTQILGPWLPKNFIRSYALSPDRGNPFRGRVAPSMPRVVTFGSPENPAAVRRFEVPTELIPKLAPGDPFLLALPGPGGTNVVDRLDPLLVQILTVPDTVRTDFGGGGLGLALYDPLAFPRTFGGDFLGGVVPCVDPTQTRADKAAPRIRGGIDPGFSAGCIPSARDRSDPTALPGSYIDPNILGITKITGGKGENPFRPAPDLSNLGRVVIDENGEVVSVLPDSEQQGYQVAQGLYIPSKGLVKELDAGSLDDLNFNYTESERAWNRGDSQEDTKELKEAYVDLELLDSRLWVRLGLQNIVWGKTELFRTTDQFNPQDLALASLPSLEESRIALWSARFVYSLYNIGPVEDVRLEFAANIDDYQNSDLGACGEPYTPDIVCSLTTGIFAHGLLGVGVAGIDRPEDPWKDPSDLEVGGRVEWRWDRFSFALTDFYGFSDFPYPDAIFFYDRSVDPASGRPLAASLPGQPLGTCGTANSGEVYGNGPITGGVVSSTALAWNPVSVTPGIDVFGQLVRGGIGRDDNCLRPGGAAGSENRYAFDEDVLDETNALYNHHANQQIFAWICAGTVGIAAALDASSCAWTIFASASVLNRQFLPGFAFVELLTPLLAGEQTGGNGGPSQFASIALNSQKYPEADVTMPLASLNRLQNSPTSLLVDRNGDGAISLAGCDSADLAVANNCDLAGFDGFDGRVSNSINRTLVRQTLDNSLTNEQRALLGCGPFYGTRCDSSVPGNGVAGEITPRPGTPNYWGPFGGLDFMNMEASALVQSWPGIEGTLDGHTMVASLPQEGIDNPDALAQPGTVGFVGGPTCTRFVETEGLVKLPGCRGVQELRVTGNTIQVDFEQGYMPSVDGCVIGSRVYDASANGGAGAYIPVSATIGDRSLTALESAELDACNGAKTRKPVPGRLLLGFAPDGSPITAANPACTGQLGGGTFGGVDHRLCAAQELNLDQLPLIHPFAGCVDSPVWYQNGSGGEGSCEFFYGRDLTQEFLGGTAALFQNELAAFSFNFLQFLTVTSCDATSFDLDGLNHDVPNAQQGLRNDPQCFDAERPYTPGRCSFTTPQYCSNVKGFLSAAGITRNTIRAGGNGRYGRRTFIWHGGGEVVLRYEQRNVFGFSADFAEDRTKTNWGVEFTWLEGVPFQDNSQYNGITKTDVYNLTVSVDRPTFINFLNPNRTFFFNSQWFFNYLPEYNHNWTFNGPVNVLFTFAVFTGYFQDRVNPQFVVVYDFMSKSGGLLPSLQYRFTESFSVTIGMLYFFGQTELKPMPIQEFGPPSNRVGPDAYKVGVDNTLALIRKRDEVFLRLRWTF